MSDLKSELMKLRPQWKVTLPCVKTDPNFDDTYPILNYYVQADTKSEAKYKAIHEWLPSHYEIDGEVTVEPFTPAPRTIQVRTPYGLQERPRRPRQHQDAFNPNIYNKGK